MNEMYVIADSVSLGVVSPPLFLERWAESDIHRDAGAIEI